MKILHVTNYFPGTHGHIGGAELACLRTMRLLAAHGHEAVAATLRFDAATVSTSEFRVHPLPVMEHYLPAKIASYLEAVKWYSLQHDPLAKMAFARVLDSERPDAVHFHNFQFLTFSLLRESTRRGLPSCLSIYDYWIFCPKAQLLRPDKSFCEAGHGTRCLGCLPPQFTQIQKGFLSLRPGVFRRAFERLDQFQVLSAHSAGVLEGQGVPAEKIRIVPLTLPPQEPELPDALPELAEHSLLFAGWLNDRKGVHIAIEAMPHILKQHPDAHLYIIGGGAKFSGDYEAGFYQFIRAHKLEPHITFLGHLAPQGVQAYLRKARVLLLPEQYANMSPLIMVEAMMNGLPVVASRLGGIPEYIEDGVTGFLAEPYAPSDFAEKACLLLREKALHDSVAARAKAHILERNSDERIGQATLAAYQELLRASG